MNRLHAIAFGGIAHALLLQPAWSVDERHWRTPNPVERHDSGDASTPQFAFDHNGNAVAVWLLLDGESSQIWGSRYTVVTKTWAPPTQIDASGAASSPAVAVDAAGNALVVWSQSSGVQARRYMTDNTLGAITPLQSVAGSSASPQIAYGADGTAFAVWHQLSGGSTQVWSNRFVTDHWEGAAQVETNAGDGLFPQIAVDAVGNAVAVWTQSTAGGSHTDILANRYTVSNHSWNLPTPVETNVGNTSAPQVAVDASGNARAIWFEFDADPDMNGSRNRIWSSRYTVNTNSWTPALVESNPGSATAPQVTVATNGNTVAVWQQSDGTRTNIWSSRSATGSDVWDTPILIETDDTGNAQSPSIAMDANGNALAVWHQIQPPPLAVLGIWAARYTPAASLTASWTPAQLIEHVDSGDAVQPRVAFDANGAAIAVWSQSDGTRFDIVSGRYSIKEWGPAQRLQAATGGGGFGPQVVVDPNGNATAAWEESHDQIGSIQSERYTSGIGWGAPSKVSGSTGNAGSVKLAKDAAGNVLATWLVDASDMGNVTQNVWANRYTPGSGWDVAALIQTEHPDGFGSDPQIAMNSNGSGIVAWWQVDPDQGINSLWSKRYVGGWRPSELIEARDGSSDVRIAIDTNGNALAIWDQFDGFHTKLASSRNAASGGGWGPSALVETNNKGNIEDSDIAFDAAGNAIAVWEKKADTKKIRSVWANHLAGGVWGAAELLEMDDTVSAFSPRVAFDTNGNALAVWGQANGVGKPSSIWSDRYSVVTGKWEGRTLVETDERSNAVSPAIAFDGNGNALALWFQSIDGVHLDIWANRYTAGSGWGIATDAVPIGADASGLELQFALDANGNPMVVWEQHISAESTWQVFASRFE